MKKFFKIFLGVAPFLFLATGMTMTGIRFGEYRARKKYPKEKKHG